MNKEIESFRDWFCGYEKEYVIIGGTACNILMGESGLTFRATKDLDLVLIVEALDTKFIEKFWQYIKIANYQHWNNSRTVPQFYRFSHPSSKCFPAMIELFTRKLENIELKYNHNLTPLSFEEEISSLSAILLNDDYYEFMKTGIRVVDGLSILDATHLIPFKIKAWLDLKKEKLDGKHVDMKNIKKLFKSKAGMELVQVAILIAIAIALGIIFKTEITSFVNKTFKALNASKF